MKSPSRICIAFMAVVGIVLMALMLWRGAGKQKPIAPQTSIAKAAPAEIAQGAPVTGKASAPPLVQPATPNLSQSKPQGIVAFDNWAKKYLATPAAEKASLVNDGMRLAQA